MTERVVPLPTRRATKLLAKSIGREVAPGDLFVLTGALGAGKTFLVRAVCRELGLPERVPVTSPTFTLVHEYPTTPPLVHADVYRLTSAEDVAGLGLLEQREMGKLLFVEWGEPFIDVLGGDAVVITLDTSPRCAEIRASGARSEAFIERLL